MTHILSPALHHCISCPHACGIDRTKTKGPCQIGATMRIASFSVHDGEEPPISGIKGAGNIFVSGCNLHCVFCQNYPISQQAYGNDYTTAEVIKKIRWFQEKKQVHNIIFVTPSHVIPQILEMIQESKKGGVILPFGYNTNSYDTVDSLRLLQGMIDIYLPDFKYVSDTLAHLYSKAPHYKEIATKAIHEMIAQVGPLQMNKEGIATKGVLIRHLVLPGHVDESIAVLYHIKKEFGTTIPLSLMNQYFPAHEVITNPAFGHLNRSVSTQEYQTVLDTFQEMGFTGYWQEEDCP